MRKRARDDKRVSSKLKSYMDEGNVMSVTYEDLSSTNLQKVMKRIQEFLGEEPQELKSRFVKIHKEGARPVLKHFEKEDRNELKNALVQSKFKSYLDDSEVGR